MRSKVGLKTKAASLFSYNQQSKNGVIIYLVILACNFQILQATPSCWSWLGLATAEGGWLPTFKRITFRTLRFFFHLLEAQWR